MTRFFGFCLLTVSIASVAFAALAPAPEIDTSSSLTALGLLGGGILILRSRKKK